MFRKQPLTYWDIYLLIEEMCSIFPYKDEKKEITIICLELTSLDMCSIFP